MSGSSTEWEEVLSDIVETPYKGNTARIPGTDFQRFFRDGESKMSPDDVAGMTPPASTAYEIQEARDQFAKNISPMNWHKRCCAVDRAAVLVVYNEALQKIGTWSHEGMRVQNISSSKRKQVKEELAQRCRALSTEVTIKVKVILGISAAEATDMVFANTMLLSPLEPQYSEPRIEFNDDREQLRVAARLKAWRDEGWPDRYPRLAITEEGKAERLWRRHGLGRTDMRAMALQWPNEIWGEEVDA